MNEDKRTQLTELFDRARVNGVAYLLVIATLGSATRPELSDITGEDEDTLGKYLLRMESRGLCIRVKDGKADRWHVSPTATATLQLHAAQGLLVPASTGTPASTDAPAPTGALLLPKISVSPSSSSDLVFDQSVSNQISDQDQSEEEEPTAENRVIEDRGFKAWLCKHYGLTGDKAQAVITDDTLIPEDLIAWMCQVSAMKQGKFPFKKSPEAYALHCLLITDRHPRRDAPNDQAIHMMQIQIDHLWTQYTKTIAPSPVERSEDGGGREGGDHEQVDQQRRQDIAIAFEQVKQLEQQLAHCWDNDTRQSLLAQRAAAHQRYLKLTDIN